MNILTVGNYEHFRLFPTQSCRSVNGRSGSRFLSAWNRNWASIFVAICSFLMGSSLYSQSPDELALIAVVENETKAFCKIPLSEVVKIYWVLDEKTLKFDSYPDGTHYVSTAADLLNETEVPPENHAIFSNSEYNYKVIGDMAFLTYLQLVTMADGTKIYSHESRVLERTEGVWRIHISSTHFFDPNKH